MSQKIDIQGHRGCRGLMPENTIPAFLKAIDLGVHTLELDLAVTKDHQLVVSHEPYMNAVIALDSLGQKVTKEDELHHNIYQMSSKQMKTYDVGSRFHPSFPEQEKMKVSKPLLQDLVKAVNQHCEDHQIPPVRYNIEIKSEPQWDNVYHPTPEIYSELVHDFIVKYLDPSHLNIQSFDFRILQYFHAHYPDITLAVLIENEESIDENLSRLGFIPSIYSCDFELIDEEGVKYLQTKSMKVIPWTVNQEESIKRMISWGVDGIISDYPDRVIKLISK